MTAARDVDERDVLAFAALTGDHHPQHVDTYWAARSPFGERIAHGMLVMSCAVGLVPFDPERVVALRRVADVVFKRPVRLGDRIHVAGEITDLRDIDGPAGIVALQLAGAELQGRDVLPRDGRGPLGARRRGRRHLRPHRDRVHPAAPVTMLDGRKLLVTGVVTKDSIAWEVARLAQEQGAEVVLTGFGRARRLTVKSGGTEAGKGRQLGASRVVQGLKEVKASQLVPNLTTMPTFTTDVFLCNASWAVFFHRLSAWDGGG